MAPVAGRGLVPLAALVLALLPDATDHGVGGNRTSLSQDIRSDASGLMAPVAGQVLVLVLTLVLVLVLTLVLVLGTVRFIRVPPNLPPRPGRPGRLGMLQMGTVRFIRVPPNLPPRPARPGRLGMLQQRLGRAPGGRIRAVSTRTPPCSQLAAGRTGGRIRTRPTRTPPRICRLRRRRLLGARALHAPQCAHCRPGRLGRPSGRALVEERPHRGRQRWCC